MKLRQKAIDLLVNVLDAADHVEDLNPEEIRQLLKQVANVMGRILERDAALMTLCAEAAPPGLA